MRTRGNAHRLGAIIPPGDPDMCLAAPARVLEVQEGQLVVDYGGVRTTARSDALAEDVSPGDYVLIHTGFAIRRLSPEDGEETLRLFDELAASLSVEGPVEDAPSFRQDTVK